MAPSKISLTEKFNKFTEHWQPHIIGELNGQHVKIARLFGEFTWHHHQHEDELFLVLKGVLEIHFKEEIVILNAGEMIIVPRGVEHKPVAKEEVQVLLFEPAGTVNTGQMENELTLKNLKWL